MSEVVDVILHCQKQLKRENLTDEKILHYLGRLTRLRVTVHDLAETGIGRTVNSLSRNEGPVGQCAEKLVRGWKRMVSEQQTQEAEKESEDESESNSGSSEEEDDEPTKNSIEDDDEQYGIPDHDRSGSSQERRYSNGHAYVSGSSATTQPNRDFPDEELEEDFNDDIDDPYMDAGFINVANVHSDGENDDDDDDDSDTSERLEIDDNKDDGDSNDEIDMKPSPPSIKQEKHYEDRESKNSSKSSSSHHKSHSDCKKSSSSSSSSKSHHNHHEKSNRESRDSKHHSSKDSKDHHRSKSSHEDHHSSSSSLSHHRSSHHQSSSKSERPKENKSENENNNHHQREKEKHYRSKENSSSYREKDRSADKKDSSNDHHRSSNSSSSSKSKNRDHASSSSSSHSSPKKSSLEVKKDPPMEDRKRKDYPNSDNSSSSSKKSKIALKDEIDSNSGVNFADVLGSLDTSGGSSSSKPTSSKKEKDKTHHHKKHHHSSSKSESSSRHSSSKDAGSSSSKKYDSDSHKSSKKVALPQSKIESVIQPVVNISPNYKPMSSSIRQLSKPGNSSGNSNGFVAPPPITLSHVDISDVGSADYWDNAGKSTSAESQEDAISDMLSNRNKNARSKVYSGVKSGRKGEVTKLYDLCMQVIKDNIGELGFTGGIPYDILKPALERATPDQLMNIEAQNDYLIGETDELWHFHCRRDFRGTVPGETESWRELYERCKEERRLRFEVVKNQMKKNIAKAEPARKAKLAYVDTSSSTRFNPQKAQTIKNGMKTLKIMEEKGPSRGVASSASAGFNNPKKSGSSANKVLVEDAAVIIAPESRAGHAPAPSVSRESSSSSAKFKPKKAPLMQKTMKLIKSLHRR